MGNVLPTCVKEVQGHDQDVQSDPDQVRPPSLHSAPAGPLAEQALVGKKREREESGGDVQGGVAAQGQGGTKKPAKRGPRLKNQPDPRRGPKAKAEFATGPKR